jgi:hypothetical protein
MGRVLVANDNPGNSSWSPTGIATITGAASTTVALPVGSTYTGALVSFASTPASATLVEASVSGTTLTITLDASDTVSVAYLVID